MNLIISGINGKMGGNIKALGEQDPFWTRILGLEEAMTTEYKTREADISALHPQQKHSQVIIDFSHPNALDDVLSFIKTHLCPLVIGTTGYNTSQKQCIRQLAEYVPILLSANMSLGMNILNALVEQVASIFHDGVDIEVIEIHHRHKIDAPSGSAQSMVNAIEMGLAEKRRHVHGRVGETRRRTRDIGIHSLRGGNVTGRHEAWFMHELETITLTHEAHDRLVFARGALKAAQFVLTANPGFYSMSHLLGLHETHQ